MSTFKNFTAFDLINIKNNTTQIKWKSYNQQNKNLFKLAHGLNISKYNYN